jgi:allantoin racemase
VDGHVIACFGDPGLLAARELAQGPVIGIAEAAMHMATLVATRFSIVTTLPRTLIIARHLLHQYGFHDHCAGCTPSICRCWRWKTAAAGAGEGARALYPGAKRGWLRRHRAGLRRNGDAGPGADPRTAVPVIDGVSAAVKMVESLVALGLSTSKRGDLAFPEAKALSGKFQAFNPF